MTKSIFIKRLSATVQFILGFVLGISLIAGISGAALFAYYKKMSVLPKRPVYPEPTANLESEADTAETFADIEPIESIATEDELEKSSVVTNQTEEAEAEAEEPEEVEPELPANAYRAVVTWPQGLSLRAEPSVNAGRIGGIDANASIIILENSADGEWQRVRLPWSNQEGWVKAGNTERTSY